MKYLGHISGSRTEHFWGSQKKGRAAFPFLPSSSLPLKFAGRHPSLHLVLLALSLAVGCCSLCLSCLLLSCGGVYLCSAKWDSLDNSWGHTAHTSPVLVGPSQGRPVGQCWEESRGCAGPPCSFSSLGLTSYTLLVLKMCSCHACLCFGACVWV